MNRLIAQNVSAVLLALLVQTAQASSVDQLLKEYRNAGAADFSLQRGEQLWRSEQAGRSCPSCHTQDPRAQGKHQKTGKPIEPMAPSVNPQRLTERKTIEKWFKRNCQWTLGRECTAQEKGDFLTWLQGQ